MTHPVCHTAMLCHFVFRMKHAVCRPWQDASFLQFKSIQVSACSLVELSHLTAFLFCCQFVMLHFQESVQPGLLRQPFLSSYISSFNSFIGNEHVMKGNVCDTKQYLL